MLQRCIRKDVSAIICNLPYRTVRACKSTGAPESTAAGRTSPSSLPSMTRFGIGENWLLYISLPSKRISLDSVRCSMVNRSMIVWLMIDQTFRRALLPDHGRVPGSRSWRSRGIRFWCRLSGPVLILPFGCLTSPSYRRLHCMVMLCCQ